MVTREAQIRLHRHPFRPDVSPLPGGPLEVLSVCPDGTGEIKVTGSDLTAGMRPNC